MSGPQLRVDLDALAANIAIVRATVAPAQLMLVVKDDAYGHGLEAVVTRAVREGVRWFGAFDVREALAVRAVAGEGARVFSWLTAGPDLIGQALQADIDLGVGDPDFLDEVAAEAERTGSRARVHLKIDSGLHRNGIRPEDWEGVLQRARVHQDAGALRVVGVWSHIAEASDAEDDRARAAFESAVQSAAERGFDLDVRHLAASAASFQRPVFRYDLTRVGAFCYGVRSAGADDPSAGIVPAATLVARVVRADDEGVTVDVGALHGLPSILAGRASFRLGGRLVRVREIGAHQTVLDPAEGSRLGDEVTVFGGEASSATDLAESIGSVGEEILVRVSPLVPRVYTQR